MPTTHRVRLFSFVSAPEAVVYSVGELRVVVGVRHLAWPHQKASQFASTPIHAYTVCFAALSPPILAAKESRQMRIVMQLASFTTNPQFSHCLGYLMAGVQRHTPSDAV